MTAHPPDSDFAELPPEAALAFSPLHKRHFGTAVGLAAALVVFGATAVHLLIGVDQDLPLVLLDQYFYGYTVSWQGALIGALWGFFTGWVAGWFMAFCRNFVLAAALLWFRTKSNIEASREFLDHI